MGSDTGSSSIRYAIDADDNLCFVDDAWGRFAIANDGPELTRAAMLGKSLWDCITDHTTRTLYRQVVARVRQGQLAEFTLRCDGPSCRRLLEMTIGARANGVVEFETRTISAEDRAPVALLSRHMTRSTELVCMCAWCNQINVGINGDEWVEIEDAMDRLRIFEHGTAPQVTHGICGSCFEGMMAQIQQLEGVA